MRGQCRNKPCPNKAIAKGELRFGRTMMAYAFDDMVTEWYHPHCMFDVLVRGRAATRKIERESDIEGFAQLRPEDQDAVRKMIAAARPKYKRPPGYVPSPAQSPLPSPAKPSRQQHNKPPAPPSTKTQGSVSVPGAASKNATVAGVQCLRLVATDGSCGATFGVGTHTIGRTTPALSAKAGVRQFSRQQALLVVAPDKLPVLRPTGTNPTVLTEASSGTSRVLPNGDDVALHEGDHIAFCSLPELDFEVKFMAGTKKTAPSAPTTPTKPPKKRARTRTRQPKTETLTSEDDLPAIDDDDEEADPTFTLPEKEVDTRPWCKYGAACYRTNKQHLIEYRHPPK